MKRACLIAWVALASACAPPTLSYEPTCDAFVAAWADYEARCGNGFDPPTGEPADDDLRAEVEETYFGTEGCDSVTEEDFRDPDALRDECPAELGAWPCEDPGLPPACADQIRR